MLIQVTASIQIRWVNVDATKRHSLRKQNANVFPPQFMF